MKTKKSPKRASKKTLIASRPQAPRDGFATYTEAHQFLGISRRSLQRMIEAGRLNAVTLVDSVKTRRIPWEQLHALTKGPRDVAGING